MMDLFAQGFASGRIIDLVVALTVLEAAALIVWHRSTRTGPRLSAFGLNLLSGLCLMLAVRAALVGAWWGFVAVWMLAALALHLADLHRIWRA
jgi:hypothetical protein